MSLNAFNRSRTLEVSEDFETIIMAAMRKADSDNLELLKNAWPEIFEEVVQRYNAPGGFLPSEKRPEDSPDSPRIFIVYSPGGLSSSDFTGYGLAEDGSCIAQHICTTVNWIIHDMGVVSDWKHDKYKEHYPQGYQLIWIGEWPEEGKHPEFDAAYALNKAKGLEEKDETAS